MNGLETNKQIYQIKWVKRLPGPFQPLSSAVRACREFEVEGTWTTQICPQRRRLAFFESKIHWEDDVHACSWSTKGILERGRTLPAKDFVIVAVVVVCAVRASGALGVIMLATEVPLFSIYNFSCVCFFVDTLNVSDFRPWFPARRCLPRPPLGPGLRGGTISSGLFLLCSWACKTCSLVGVTVSHAHVLLSLLFAVTVFIGMLLL